MTNYRQRSGAPIQPRTLVRLMLASATAMLLVINARATAGPEGENVVHGAADFARTGLHTDINVHTQNAIINYNSFNLTSQESVRFQQLNAASRVLNRIQSAAPTHIDGSVMANGQVYFVNPAGVRFGPNAVLDVAGIYAAAGAMSNTDFIAGVDRFTSLSGDVINQGTINSQFVALVGQRVVNDGVIFAPNGLVTMAAGDEVLIGEQNGNILVKVQNNSAASDAAEAAVVNNGQIDAAGGTVTLGASDMYWLGVKQSAAGSIEAEQLITEAPGAVEIEGAVDVADSATITADEIAFYNAGIGGGDFVLNGSTVTVGNIAGTGAVAVVGTAGDDTHKVDMSLGSALPDGGLTFEGGYSDTQFPGDVLIVVGDGSDIYRAQGAGDDTGKTGSYTIGNYTFYWSGYEPTDTDAAGGNLTLDFTGTTVTTINILVGQDIPTDTSGANTRIRVEVDGDGESESFFNAADVTVLGGGGAETFTYNVPNNFALFTGKMTLSGDNNGSTDVSNDVFNITAFDGLNGFEIIGGGGQDTINGPDNTSFGGAPAPLVTYEIGGGTIDPGDVEVSGVEVFVGGANIDIYNVASFNSGAIFSINGGGNTNDAIGGPVAGSTDWQFGGTAAVGLLHVTNVEIVGSGGGDDTFNLAGFAPTTVSDTGGTNEIVGQNSAETFNVTGNGVVTVGGINFDGNIDNLDGAGGDDDFIMGANGVLSGTIDGGTGTNTLTVTGKGTPDVITVAANVQVGGTTTNFSNIDDVTVNAGDGGDFITVTPQAGFTINIDGQGGVADTDSLTVNLAGIGDAVLTQVGAVSTIASTGMLVEDVTVTNVEAIGSVNNTFDVAGINAASGGGAGDNAMDDIFTVSLNAGVLEILVNADGGGDTSVLAGLDADSVGNLTIDGSGDTDSFIVDFNNSLIPNFGLTVNGAGAADNDSLTIQNGAFTTTTYNYTNANDGSVVLVGAGTSTITYTGLEPITNSGTAADIIFNLPDGTANNDVALIDDAGANDNISNITSAFFENTTFTNPTNSLTVNLGDMGDTITVSALDAMFDADVTVTGGTMDDTINLVATTGSQPYILNGGAGDDTFNLGGTGATTSLDAIALAVTVNGGAQTAGDVLNFNDTDALSTDTAQAYTFTTTTLDVSGVTHTHSGNETININGSDQADSVDVQTTGATTTALNFNLNGGDDVATVASAGINAATALGINGGGAPAGDTLTVNGSGVADTINVANTTVTRTGNGTTTFADIETLAVDTGAGAGDNIDVADGITSVGTAVNLTSAGDITDAGADGTTNITSTTTTLQAVTGIDTDTDVDNLNATNTGAGNIDINQTTALTTVDIDAQNGNATLDSDAAINDSDASVDVAATGTATVTSTGGAIGTTGNRLEIDAPMIVTDTNDAADNNQFLELADGVTDLNLDAGTAIIGLTTAGTVNQVDNTDVITADGLALSGSGTFNLDGNNLVGNVASDMTGTFLLENDSLALDVDTVNGVAGITSGANATLRTKTAGNLSLTQAANVSGNLTIDSVGNVAVNADADAGGAVDIDGATGVTLTGAFDISSGTTMNVDAAAGNIAFAGGAGANATTTMGINAAAGSVTFSGNAMAGTTMTVHAGTNIAGAGATLTATTMDLDASTGIGGTGGDGNDLLTVAGSLSADNDTSGDVQLMNTIGSGTTLTSGSTTGGGEFDLDHSGSLLTVAGTVTTADAGGSGNLRVVSDSGLDISGATFTTTGGVAPAVPIVIESGGITFGATFTAPLGSGVITLGGGATTLSFDQDQTFPGSVAFNIAEDILINANLITTDGNVTLNADFDNNGTGGIRVSLAGLVQANDNAVLNGSDLVSTATPNDAILIDNDGGNDQVASEDAMIMFGVSSNADADFIISGDLDAETGMTFASGANAGGTTNIGASFDSTGGLIDFQDDIVVIGDVDITTADSVDFDATVNDDGSVSSSDVQVNIGGDGGDAFNIRGVIGGTDPIESLTVNDVGGTQSGVANAAADISTDGSTMTFNLAFILLNDVILTDAGTGIFFNDRVDGDGLGPWQLTANTTGGGTTRFGDQPGVAGVDQVGGVNPLGGLITDSVLADGTTIINTDLIQTDITGAGVGVGAVTFNDPVTIGHTVGAGLLIDTTLDATDAGGPVSFNSTLNGAAIGANHLNVDVGTMGADVLFNGAVGGTTRLGDLDILRSDDVTANAGVTALSVGVDDASAGTVVGDVVFGSFINTNGETGLAAGNVDIDATGTVSVVGNITAVGATNAGGAGFAGGSVTIVGDTVSVAGINSSGGASTMAGSAGGNAMPIFLDSENGGAPQITIAGDLQAAGGSPGAGGANGMGHDITLGTDGDMDTISLAGVADLLFSTGTRDGNIDINGPLGGPGGIGLTLLSGDEIASLVDGVIDFEGTVQNLTFLTITDARNVNFDMAVGGAVPGTPNVGAITQSNGTGTTDFNSTVFSSGSIDIQTERILVDMNVVTQGGGSVTYTTDLDDVAGTSGSVDTLIIANDADHTLNGGGSFTQAGGGVNMPVVDLGGDITTAGTGSISFADHVRLTNTTTGLVTLTTGGALGADITFDKNLFAATDFTEDITLNAGGSGDISIAGMVGEDPTAAAAGEIDEFTITNARDTQFGDAVGDTVEVNLLVQTSGTGDTTFEGPVTVAEDSTAAAASVVALNIATAGTLTFNSTLNATMAGDLIMSVGDIEFNGGADSITSTVGGAAKPFIRLEPFADGANMAIGVGGATFTVTNTDALALTGGFTRIEIGESGLGGGADGTGTIFIGNGVTFEDPVMFRAPAAGGSIAIQSALNGTDDTFFVFDSRAITLGGDITTAGGGVGFVSGGSESAPMMFSDIDDDLGDENTATDDVANVIVNLDSIIDTTNGGGTPAGADVVFENRIDGDGGDDNLEFTLGTAGDLEVGIQDPLAGATAVDGLVGSTNRLGDILINSANDATFGLAGTPAADGTVIATSFTQTTGTGNTTFHGDALVAGKPTSLQVGGFDDEAGGMVAVNLDGPASTFTAAAAINATGGANTGGGNGFDGGSVNVTAFAIDVHMIDSSGSAANTGGNGGDAAPITLASDVAGGTAITLRGDLSAIGGAPAGGGTIGDAADIGVGDGADDAIVLDPALIATMQVVLADTITVSGNDITWDGTIDAAVANADSLTTNTFDNAGQVPIYGTNTFNFNIGPAAQLQNLITNYGGTQVPGGATVFNAPFVNVQTLIDINDRAVVTNTGNGELITFQGAAGGGTQTATTRFDSTLDTDATTRDVLIIADMTEFNGNVGTLGTDGIVGGLADNPFDTFTTDEPGGDGGDDMTFLNAETFNADEFFFNDDIKVALDDPAIVTVTGTTGVDFNNNVDSAAGESNNLTVNTGGAGVINFGDTATDYVGSTTPLNNLVTGAMGTTVFNADNVGDQTVETAGDQTYNNDVVLAMLTDKTLLGQNITFSKTINGSLAGVEGLTLNPGNTVAGGTVNILGDIGTGPDGNIGGGDDLAPEFLIITDATTPGSSIVNLGNGGAIEIEVAGAVDSDINEAVILNNDVTIVQVGTGDFIFDERVDSMGAGTFGLATGSLVGTADFIFNDTVGAGADKTLGTGDDTPLAFITTDDPALQGAIGAASAMGRTIFNGGVVHTQMTPGTGIQTYNDWVQIGGGTTTFDGFDLVFNAMPATFVGSLDAFDASGFQDVNLVAANDITFLGDIGADNNLPIPPGEAIDDITFTAGGNITLQGVFTTGTQTYNFADKLVLGADLLTDGASIAFVGTGATSQLILMDPDGTLLIDTNDDDLVAGGPSTGDSGNLTMTNLEVSADPTGGTLQDFDIFTESDDMLGGDVVLQGFNNDTVGGMGGNYVNDLTIEASSVAGTADADQAFLQLNADIQLDDNGTGDAADFRFDTTFTSEVYISDDTPGTPLIVDTEIGDTAAGGLINWSAQISADAPGQDLVLDTSSTSFVGGSITHASVENNGGVATAGNPTPAFLNDFTAIAGGTTLGTYDWSNVSAITLDDEGAGADPGDLTVTNANIRTLIVSTTIDTEATNDFDGGNVDLSTSMLSSNIAGNNGLIVNTLTDGAGMTGGNVTLGEFGGDGAASAGLGGGTFGAHFIRNLTVNTTGDTPFGGNAAGTGADGVTNVIFDILIDGNSSGGLQPFVMITGDLRIDVDPIAGATIDTEATGDEDAGFVDLEMARVFGNDPARIFIVDTSSAGNTGGDVDLGPVNMGTGNFLNVVTLDSSGAAPGTTTLHGDVLLDDSLNGGVGTVASMFTITGDGGIVVSKGPLGSLLLVDTEQGGDADGGAVNWNNALVDADAVGQDLSILTNNNTPAGGFDGGAVTFGEISNGGGAFLNDLLIDATGDTIFGGQPADTGTDGIITILDNRVATDDDGAGDLASITMRGEVQITFNSTTFFDTEFGGDADGGPIDLSRAGVSATADGLALDIDTQTSAPFDGGAVMLHRFNDAGGSFVEDLIIDTGGATPGTTTLNANILLDPDGASGSSFNLNDDGDLVISDDTPGDPLIVDLEQGDDESAATSFFDVDASNISADAQGQNFVVDVSSGFGGGSGGEIRVDTIDDGTVSIANGGGGFFLNNLALIVTNPGETVGTAQIEIANDGSALGGLVTTDRHQHYYGPTALFADTVLNSNGVDGTTVTPAVANIDFVHGGSTIDGAFDLTVNTGLVNANGGMNMTRFNGAIGGATPLVSVTTNADGFTVIGNNVTTVGDSQHYMDPVLIEPIAGLVPANTVTLIDTAATPAATGIDFDATVDAGSADPFALHATTVTDADGNLVAYDLDAVDPDLIMTVLPGGGGQGNINFDGIVGGMARLGDVLVTNTNNFTADLAFTAQTFIQSGDSAGAGTIIADPDVDGGAGFTRFDGLVTLDGAVGVGNVDNYGGGGVVVGRGGDLFIAVTGDIFLNAGATSMGAGGAVGGDMTFYPGSNAAADGGQVIAANLFNGVPAPFGIVQFGGMFNTDGGDFFIVPNGYDVVPGVATFQGVGVGPNVDVTIDVGAGNISVRDDLLANLNPNGNNKGTFFGNLTLIADGVGGSITVMDLNSFLDQTVNSPTINILVRAPSMFLNNTGGIQTDLAVDFVTGGDFFWSSAPNLIPAPGGPDPIFANGDAMVPIGSPLSGYIQTDFPTPIIPAFASFAPSAAGPGLGGFPAGTRALDLTTLGASNANVAEAIAAAIPTPEQSGDVIRDLLVGEVQRDLLSQLGVDLRDLTTVEKLEYISGSLMINDQTSDLQLRTGNALVARDRLLFEPVRQVLETYSRIFLERVVDESGQETFISKHIEIRRGLADALEAYSASGAGFDAGLVMTYLRADPERFADAIEAMEGLAELEKLLLNAGLAPREVDQAMRSILERITPEGYTIGQMYELMRAAGQPAAEPTAGEGETGEPTAELAVPVGEEVSMAN